MSKSLKRLFLKTFCVLPITIKVGSDLLFLKKKMDLDPGVVFRVLAKS